MSKNNIPPVGSFCWGEQRIPYLVLGHRDPDEIELSTQHGSVKIALARVQGWRFLKEGERVFLKLHNRQYTFMRQYPIQVDSGEKKCFELYAQLLDPPAFWKLCQIVPIELEPKTEIRYQPEALCGTPYGSKQHFAKIGNRLIGID
jgi:hypothetical protein